MIKLFSVDDSDQFLDYIAALFAPYSKAFEIVGRYGAVGTDEDVEDLIETIEATKPDIVLMDFNFSLVDRPSDFGIELTKRIIRTIPGQKIIMLVTDDDPFNNTDLLKMVKRSFNAGAIAYLRKGEPEVWFACIKEVALSKDGPTQVPKTVIQIIIDRLIKGGSVNLSEREIQAISLLADDKKVRDIAPLMNIGFDGVNFHLNNAKVKLGVTTLQGLVCKAFREGYIY